MPEANGAIEFATEEYKVLWDYVKRTLEEREITLNYYFRTVTIPSAALAAFTFLKVRQQSGTETLIFNVNPPTVAAALLVISLVGIACLLKYHLEAVNARAYFLAINEIRKFFRKEYPQIDGYLIIDKVPPGKRSFFLRIPFYGSAIIVIINSAILLAAIQLLCSLSTVFSAGIFVGMLAAQVIAAEIAGKLFIASGERRPGKNK
jgi:hypothetical protein